MPLPPTPGDALVGQRVAAAVSGGADSVALALWLHDLASWPQAAFTMAGLIHVNHQLRGAHSEADEAFCRALAARLQVPIDVVAAPVLVEGGRSPEAAARDARYAAFEAAAARLGATVVATAHTADDQAETVLLRLLRGAGLRGLSGVRAGRGHLVRPLLECRRADLRAWLEARGEPWREDASNADVAIPRNRVRHQLLPVVEQVAAGFAPGAVPALARFAAFAADDERYLEEAAIELAARIVQWQDQGATIVRTALAEAPPALARRVVRLVAERVAPGRPWSAVHLEAVLRLARRVEGGGSLDLPDIFVSRVSNEVRVSRSRGARETFRGPFASD